MTVLYPSLQAERIRSAVVDYLSTAFALTDAESRRALADFLEDPERGVFTGPFVCLRLPYQPSPAAPHRRTGRPRQRQPRQRHTHRRYRHHHLHHPPDILLTNYKMLDQLLLRPEDQELWAASATSSPR